MQDFESMQSFLEHISLVMDAESEGSGDAVTLMTLHAAKGLEYDTVFLPGWEEGLFPHQRAMDESGDAGLEEERRLAYVGLTRARRNVYVWFAINRRVRGMWNATAPSRFLDELPEAHVEVREAAGVYGGRGGYGGSRFDRIETFSSTYRTPGWERARARGRTTEDTRPGRARLGPQTIEGELVAKSVGTAPSGFRPGERVFHLKFGNGDVAAVEGNKLTVDFDKAGRKRVLESFVERV
jgi:DNA helicase-2/ATP-dependent DNA helicase PcrA